MSSVSPETWKRLRPWLDEALELTFAEREAWLRARCADDPEVLELGLSILRRVKSDDGILERPLGEFGQNAIFGAAETHTETDPLLGRQIGNYTLRQEIGRGGMGVVYLADRSDAEFEQEVVIKLPPAGVDTHDRRARFLMERQVLAGLSHPNIARLLDGGVTEQGQPYIVMEHVDGHPIDQWCDTSRLPIKARLRLFLSVLDAVAHAHHNLVVHRDLKPANVFVTADGHVKLLDFGIAKVLDASEGVGMAAFTRPGVPLMTPEYASPEQAQGEKVTTASDVYQLGLLLYLLLTGENPQRGSGRSLADLRREITDGKVSKPSATVTHSRASGLESDHTVLSPLDRSARRCVSPGRLRRQIRGDLDRIVLMALRKEPERRYSSADSMAEDIRRHLDGRPVQAQDDTFVYRTVKLLERHRVLATALVVALVVAAGLSVVDLMQVQEERDRAQLEALQKQEVTDLLIDLFRSSEQSAGQAKEITARELLDRAASRLHDELAEQPALRLRMLDVVSEVSVNVGLFGKAHRLLEEALALSRSFYGEESLENVKRMQRLANLLKTERDFSGAVTLYQQALGISRRLAPEDKSTQVDLLESLALVMRDTGDLDGAESSIREALALQAGQPSTSLRKTATMKGTLAYVLRRQGRIDEAESLYRELLSTLRGSTDDVEGVDIIHNLNNLAFLLKQQRRYAEAEPLYREALQRQSAHVGGGHPVAAMIRCNLAVVLAEEGKIDESEQILRENLDLVANLQPEGSWRVGAAHDALGQFYRKMGFLEKAVVEFRAGLEVYRKALGASHSWTACAEADLAVCLYVLGRDPEAARLSSRSDSSLRAVEQRDDAHVEFTLMRIIEFLDQRELPEWSAHYRALRTELHDRGKSR
jgi:eukaryotic-like serine/threonine-protein kinase